MNKINWRHEFLDSSKFNKKEKKLLNHGAQSLLQSWLLGTLYTPWKKMKGYRETSIPNCQSSFLEQEKRLAGIEFYVLTKGNVLYPDWQ